MSQPCPRCGQTHSARTQTACDAGAKRMTSRYPGTCRDCGGKIIPGQPIYWGRTFGMVHALGSDCVRVPSASAAAEAESVKKSKISRGEGYGGTSYTVGEVIALVRDGIVVRVVAAHSRFVREDGLSFGVGSDEGHIYSADVVPASAE